MAMAGGATTEIDAEAVEPTPPSAEVTLPVTLLLTPAVVPVTFTEKVHEPPAASDAPERLTRPVPPVAVIVPVPQLPIRPLGVETTRPAGRVSVKSTALSADVELGLPIVKLSEVELFSGIDVAPNDLEIVGGATTVREAAAVLPAPLSTALTLTLLF